MMRLATILLICSVGCALAQYGEDAPVPKKPLLIPNARRLKAQPRLASSPSPQTGPLGNQRFRRPIPISRPRPSAEPIPELPVFTSGIRGSRPSAASIGFTEQNDEASVLPIQAIQQPHIVHATPLKAQQQQQQQNQVKPVNEDNEKDEDVVQVIANLGQVSSYGAQGNLLTPTAASPAPSPTPAAYLHERQLERQQEQHQQRQQERQNERQQERQQERQDKIQPVHYKPSQQIVLPDAHIHQVIAPVQYRPQKPVRLQKQQQQQQLVDRNEYDINEARPLAKQRAQVAPKKSKPQSDYYEGRTKKPVAQVIRRYREETADGSIIWGFENDDGSFKEEIIGIDCITRGKYGYVDPDGLRREYTYETGIKCDEETQQQQDQDILNTFVDYQENKLVLPSGKTIDLSSMGKKQARRPQQLYRN